MATKLVTSNKHNTCREIQAKVATKLVILNKPSREIQTKVDTKLLTSNRHTTCIEIQAKMTTMLLISNKNNTCR